MRNSPLRLITVRLFIFLAMSVSSLTAIAAPQSQEGKRILVVYFSQPEDVKLEGVDGGLGLAYYRKITRDSVARNILLSSFRSKLAETYFVSKQ